MEVCGVPMYTLMEDSCELRQAANGSDGSEELDRPSHLVKLYSTDVLAGVREHVKGMEEVKMTSHGLMVSCRKGNGCCLYTFLCSLMFLICIFYRTFSLFLPLYLALLYSLF